MPAWIPGLTLACFMMSAPPATAAGWVRGGPDGTQPWWGIQGGLQFAIPPASQGPRGLVRVLYPTLPDGKLDLINFIAVEPIVDGRRGYSELERSRLDRAAGKRFWVDAQDLRGALTHLEGGVEKLQVVVRIEDFDNGARVRLVIEQRADRPDEIALTLETSPGSAAIEYGILTATMGNKARARLLHLRDETLSSLKLYAAYTGPHFAEPTVFPLKSMTITREGDLLVAITTDEEHPSQVQPFPGRRGWYYGGFPVTQYWAMRRGTWRDDVHAVVNARYMYWRTLQPIPGGISFENFELRERFREGQTFIFGITRKPPAELGLGSRVSTSSTAPS